MSTDRVESATGHLKAKQMCINVKSLGIVTQVNTMQNRSTIIC